MYICILYMYIYTHIDRHHYIYIYTYSIYIYTRVCTEMHLLVNAFWKLSLLIEVGVILNEDINDGMTIRARSSNFVSNTLTQ